MKIQRRQKKVQKTRKDLRKEKRQQKKVNRFNYHSSKKGKRSSDKEKKGKSKLEEARSSDNEDIDDEEIPSDFSENEEAKPVAAPKKTDKKQVDKFEQHLAREKKEENEYYNEIKKNRVEQLQQQNEEEDKIISKYEKLLKLNKRKRKNGTTVVSKFNDGLDYLLELCTDESIQKMYSAAKEVDQEQSDNDIGEDFELALGNSKKKKKIEKNKSKFEESVEPSVDVKEKKRAEKLKEVEKKYFGDDEDFFNNFEADSCEGSDSELETEKEEEFAVDTSDSDDIGPEEITKKGKSKKIKFEHANKNNSKVLSDSEDSEFAIDNNSDEGSESNQDSDDEDESEAGLSDEENIHSASEHSHADSVDNNSEDAAENEKPDEWEDIYGRKRDRAGNLIKEDSTKYVPPHMRKTLETETENDPKRREKLQNLKRQIKGQINRLAESNLHRITIDIENIYGKNARHDVNSTLTEVITDSLISNVLAVERLVLEQMLLIATLHANIGSEIGAFFLQMIVEKFDAMFKDIDSFNVADKSLDNVILIICHLFTYRLFKHNLIYELLDKLCEKMTEKRVECTLLVLRSIGFILRKDDPLMLKGFIVKVQKLANTAGEETAKNTRVMFMLDILIAIKNNNVKKIPQFDPSLVEHFRKLLKQFVRAGKYVTTLAITMEDLLKADERGKWWLVGSAWAGNENREETNEKSKTDSTGDEQRQKIFELARKQRMNTDDKKNVFYILMTAEDYLDAFEKIVATVKDERSVVSVIVHCCLSEKEYNPYYSIIAQKFCEHNRKYLLALQFTLWDRIKDINGSSIKQVSNLAKLVIFLIENNTLPMSVLKVIAFSQIEKTTLRFLRQVMLGLLLIEEEKFHQVFERIAPSTKLNPFKDQLRLFMKVFLMKDEKKINISEEQMTTLKHRMHQADKFLIVKHY